MIPVVVFQLIVLGPGPTIGEHARLAAWSAELPQVHRRLRYALQAAQGAAGANPSDGAARELLLFCHGFCLALSGHHEGEDRELFPAIAAAHPELRDALRYLQQGSVCAKSSQPPNSTSCP
ncbi:hemerythrin domain-containing protein [Microbacterium sp. zg.Y909]|uniref:hemerythrin domain-containing protein n=1 Tax=Microbacterium sp. zg.Y909 TaxID=2969413 RepID=UPI00214AFB35|nr:hemerythrin domain-containing protein [Microbacterium sp. zg.Y909]MCR2826253.1 hemerythrin domain-containing protein [Microbacterium sp. zg.Y909]